MSPVWSLGEMMSFVTARTGRAADVPASDVSRMVNLAYGEVVETAGPHALLEKIAVSSTTSGENRITLPADFDAPVVVSLITAGNQSGTTLTRRDSTYASTHGPRPLGEPDSYVFFGNYLELVPSPNSAYSLELRYRSLATDLVATGDIPSIATPWRPAIVFRAEAHVWAYRADWQAEALAHQRAGAFMSALKSDEARRQMDESGMRFVPMYREVPQRSARSFDFN